MSTRIFPTRIPENVVGLVLAFEFTADFLAWAEGRDPAPAEIMGIFGVSRATAYRYRSALQMFRERRSARVGSARTERRYFRALRNQ